MDLHDAKVLVTGGATGIGLETARMLGAAGAKVTICGRRADRLEGAAKETGAIPIQGNVRKEEDVKRVVKTAIEKMGGLNVLINNAGYGKFELLVDMDLDLFRDIIETNVFGAMYMARECAKYMIQQNYGNIINISSTAVAKGSRGGSAYVASKGALKGMNDSWRAELRKNNIRVMLVNPSEVQTEFSKVAGYDRPKSDRKLRGEEIAAAIKGMLEMDDRGFTTELTVFATNPES